MKRIRTRATAAVVVGVVLALVLSGCGVARSVQQGPVGEPVSGGVLVYATDVQPTAGGLDPFVTSAFANQNVIVQVYESLLTRTDDGTLAPGLAESWEQVDDRRVEVTLREGVRFSDGTPLETSDVVFSFETMMVPPAPQAQYLRGLESVRALDDRRVEFVFTEPNGAFLNVVAARGTAMVVNQEWYESTPPEQRQRSTLGTGPFALTRWVDNVQISLRRNEHYWRPGLPRLDGVDFQIVPDETARVSALRQGTDVDAAWLRDATLALPLGEEGMTVGRNAATRGLNVYVDATSGPLADVDVRRAISLAMDREQMLRLGALGNGQVSLPLPAGDPQAVLPDGQTPFYQRDVAGARRLLDQAGQPAPTVTLTYASDASFALDVPSYEVLKQNLAEAGITLELRGVPWTDVITSYLVGDWQGLIAVPGTFTPDVTSYLTTVLNPGAPTNKVTVEGDPGVAELDRLFTLTDPADRAEQLTEVLDVVADQAYLYTLYAQPQRFEVWSPRVQGYQVDPYTYRWRLAEAWLRPDEER